MKEEFGFSPENYLLYRTFIGDKSDNIPGIKGVGTKSLIKHFPIICEDREISVDEIVEAQLTGSLKEIFGTGTAVVVLPIKSFGYKNKDYSLSEITNSYSNILKEKLTDIQYNKSKEYEKWKFIIT